MTAHNDIDAEAQRLAKQGLGWQDIHVRLRHLGITEYDARCIVLGKGRAVAWWRRVRERQQMAEAS